MPRIPAKLPVLVSLFALAGAAFAPRPTTAASSATLTQDVFARMEAERAAAGLPDLAYSATAAAVAEARAQDMAANGYLDHISPGGVGPLEWLAYYGASYHLVGENIGRGDAALGDLAAVMHAAWMASEGHRVNILDPRFGRAGVGVAVSGSTYYLAVVFLD